MPQNAIPGAAGTAAGANGARSVGTTLNEDSDDARSTKGLGVTGSDFSEDTVATEFARTQSDQLLFDHDGGQWMTFSGSHWTTDKLGLAHHRMRILARRMASEVAGPFFGARKAAGRNSFVIGSLHHAKNDPALGVVSDHFDADPWLLGTPKGVVDLRDGTTGPAQPRDLVTKIAAIGPADEADCPTWRRFLDEATGGDTDLVRFLKQWAGYSLSGDVREHSLVFIHGPGGNGKSVFLSVLTEIAGDYAKTASMDTFAVSKFERHSTELAALRGARLVTASETESGRDLAETRLKLLTGGDPITARFMRRDSFTFKPQFKLILVGNHEPQLRVVDDAIRRRLIVVSFTHQPKAPDRELLPRLRPEYPAILRWMIEGCLDWQANGLIRPASVVQTTDQYFERQDFLGQWLADECIVALGDPSRWAPTRDLYSAWVAYARAAGEEPGSHRSFSGLLRKRGLLLDKGAKGRRIIRFVDLQKRADSAWRVRP